MGGPLILGARPRSVWGATTAGIDQTLRASLQQHKIPMAVAMACTSGKTTYSGAFGKRDLASSVDVNADSIFGIASMTKPITSVAAMQLVEQGKLKLDEPASTYIRNSGSLRCCKGFDRQDRQADPETSHQTGHAADAADPYLRLLLRHLVRGHAALGEGSGKNFPLGTVAPLTPLMFEPGSRWQYGTSADWSGRLVETVSGLTLEQYFQKNILEPLGMHDTSFLLPAAKFDRLVAVSNRQPDGALKENPRTQPQPPKAFNGGGGLYSTANDYVRFMQMILRRGQGPKNEQILQAENGRHDGHQPDWQHQRGKTEDRAAGYFKRRRFSPRHQGRLGIWLPDQFERLRRRRARPGSLAWAGIWNTYFWIDPRKGMAGVIMMQFLPFADKEAVAVLGDFERAVYAAS